jgi:uncharacterized sporulation protein YeaH/YhbH (DUF444 family)
MLSPQLLEFFEEQESEGCVVSQAQKVWREAFPVRKYALVAADFNKGVNQTPASAVRRILKNHQVGKCSARQRTLRHL